MDELAQIVVDILSREEVYMRALTKLFGEVKTLQDKVRELEKQ